MLVIDQLVAEAYFLGWFGSYGVSEVGSVSGRYSIGKRDSVVSAGRLILFRYASVGSGGGQIRNGGGWYLGTVS